MKVEDIHTHTEMAGSPTAAPQQTMHDHFSELAGLINVPMPVPGRHGTACLAVPFLTVL